MLNTAVLLLTVVVGALVYQLVTDKDFLTGRNEPWCATVEEEPFCSIGYVEEVLHNQTGRTLFQNNCAQCHDFHAVIVGPPLYGVMERHPKEWVYSFVLNSSKMVEDKDSAAITVFKEYAKQQMPAFAFSRADLDSLFDYINAQPNIFPVAAMD
ncbi:cytochrome c [Rufibacter immobilis]|uniref:Cytochrome c n=1 Tax=Rufibacter immobilis TaxID=1348778 RepID=A0A3M9MQY3_9BACT|nr:cytochrome c [Rufibacter immobilis]